MQRPWRRAADPEHWDRQRSPSGGAHARLLCTARAHDVVWSAPRLTFCLCIARVWCGKVGAFCSAACWFHAVHAGSSPSSGRERCPRRATWALPRPPCASAPAACLLSGFPVLTTHAPALRTAVHHVYVRVHHRGLRAPHQQRRRLRLMRLPNLTKLHVHPCHCRGPSRPAGWLESPPARGGL